MCPGACLRRVCTNTHDTARNSRAERKDRRHRERKKERKKERERERKGGRERERKRVRKREIIVWPGRLPRGVIYLDYKRPQLQRNRLAVHFQSRKHSRYYFVTRIAKNPLHPTINLLAFSPCLD